MPRMDGIYLGKDCWIGISEYLTDYRDWNSLRSTCSYLKRWLIFPTAWRRWGEEIHCPYLPIPISFFDWVPGLKFHFRATEKNPLVEYRSGDTKFNRNDLKNGFGFTENLIWVRKERCIYAMDKRTGEVMLRVQINSGAKLPNMICMKNHTISHIGVSARLSDVTADVIDEKGFISTRSLSEPEREYLQYLHPESLSVSKSIPEKGKLISEICLGGLYEWKNQPKIFFRNEDFILYFEKPEEDAKHNLYCRFVGNERQLILEKCSKHNKCLHIKSFIVIVREDDMIRFTIGEKALINPTIIYKKTGKECFVMNLRVFHNCLLSTLDFDGKKNKMLRINVYSGKSDIFSFGSKPIRPNAWFRSHPFGFYMKNIFLFHKPDFDLSPLLSDAKKRKR